MGIAPAFAIPKALERAGLTPDRDRRLGGARGVRSVALAILRELPNQLDGFEVPDERLNPNGGAVAIGHPFGSSGTRYVLTLATELRLREARYGVLGVCVGSGQGVALVLENPRRPLPEPTLEPLIARSTLERWQVRRARPFLDRSWRRSPGSARSALPRSARCCTASAIAVSVHSDHRGRGGGPGAAGRRDRPARRVGVPGRDEPAVGPDGVSDGGRRPSPCATSRSSGTPALASVRRRPARRVLLSAFMGRREGLQQRAGDRTRDRRPALVAARRGRSSSTPAQPSAAHLARPRARGRHEAAALIGALDARRAAAGAAPRRDGAAQPDQRRGVARARHRPGTRRAARRSTWSSSAAARPGSAPRSTARRRDSTRSSSRAPRSAARPAPRAGSRTTSASPPGSAASS